MNGALKGHNLRDSCGGDTEHSKEDMFSAQVISPMLMSEPFDMGMARNVSDRDHMTNLGMLASSYTHEAQD